MPAAWCGVVVLLVAGCAATPRERDDARRVLPAPVVTIPLKVAVVARGQGEIAPAAPQAPADAPPLELPNVIYFDTDHYKVSPQYHDLIARHALNLKSNPALRLVVQGHTDDRGPRRYNEALARKRAEMVARLLTEQGARRDQLEVVAFGATLPAGGDDGGDARARSRRVELVYADRR